MSFVNHKYGNLISKLKENVNNILLASIAEMFLQADETLFEMAESADSNKEQNRYFELMRDTRALKDGISADFINTISTSLRPFEETVAEKSSVKKRKESELSLVDQAEIEDMVLVKSMSGNATARLREPLHCLEARLEHLALQTPDVFYQKALHPINIFQAYDDALGQNFDIANKKTLFNFFNDHVALKLGNLYNDLNQILIDADILPKVRLHTSKASSRHAPAHRASPGNEHAEAGSDAQYNSDQEMNQGGYAMTAAPGHAYPGGQHSGGTQGDGQGVSWAGDQCYGEAGGHQGGGGQASFDQTPSQQGSGGVAGGGVNESGPAGYQHTTAGMPASQVGDVIGQYLGGAPLMPRSPADENIDLSAGSPFFPVPTSQHYGHQEILNALSNVQHNPVFNNADGTHYDGEAIKQAVLSEIAKSSGGGVTKSINRIAEKTIDFIELVFDAIIDDDNISDTIKTLLLRLQIPVIKASMIDQEFFIYDEHPARVLLDKIAHVGIGVADRHDEIYSHLDKIVTTLVSDFELQAESFEIALNSLNTFLEERDAEALKIEAQAQRQVLREHARSTVLKSLRLATRGKVLPEAIHALVLKRWPTMMYNHYLKQGKENNEWVNIVDTLRAIINSVQPLKSADDLELLISGREHLITSTHKYLQRTNQSAEDIEQVTQDLNSIHQALIDQADFSHETETVANEAGEEETISAEVSAPVEPAPEEEAPPKLKLPSGIIPGTWFQVYNGEDKAQRRCKLSVIILEDQKLVFVNYQGAVVIEKNLGEFLQEMADGKSKAIMGRSVFDYALSSVVTSLQQSH
ncbi:MAG: DUF1631 family protein [Gammaproteobacteria bacterium]|nr:DUF1631 family protein [Gammaproteobacteria bacterium]